MQRTITSRRFSRRRMIAALGAAAVLPVLGACSSAPAVPTSTTAAGAPATKPAGGAAATAPAGAQPAASGGTTTIRVADRPSTKYQKFMQTWIDQYQGKHPNIKIQFEPKTGDWDQKNVAAMAAGTAPDVMAYCCEWFRILQQKGQFAEIDGYIKSSLTSEDLADFWKTQYQAMNLNGKQLAIPYYINVNATYLNLDALKEAGLEKPKPDWTHDDFLSYAQKLTKRNGSTTERWGLITDYPQYFRRPISLVWARGGQINDPSDPAHKFTFTKKETVDAVQWVHDLLWKHKVASVTQADLGGLGLAPAFWAGKSGLYLEGIHIFEDIPDNVKFGWDLVPPPVGPAKTNGQRTSNDGYPIYAGSKNKDTAWQVILDLTSSDTMKMRQKIVGLVASRKSAVSEWITNFPKLSLKPLVDTMDTGQIDPLAVWDRSNDVYNAIKPTLEQMNILNKITVPDALAKMQADTEKVLSTPAAMGLPTSCGCEPETV
jgi:ABC-type glycerol-3-phosphate transport system substrate-binding protein